MITANDVVVLKSPTGTGLPSLMKGTLLLCKAFSSRFAPMNAKMTARP